MSRADKAALLMEDAVKTTQRKRMAELLFIDETRSNSDAPAPCDPGGKIVGNRLKI